MGVLVQLILVTCLLTLAAAQESQQVNVLSETFEQDDQGYHFAYGLDNGQEVEESGRVVPGTEPGTGSLEVQGSYSFVGDDGKTYKVMYVANEGGFQPQGDHLPVAPAQIPEYAQLRAEHPELFWAESAQKPAAA